MKHFSKLIALLLVVALLLPNYVFADDGSNGVLQEQSEQILQRQAEQAITADNVVIIGATPSAGTEYTGNGNTNTTTRTEIKTPEQIANEEIQQLFGTIEEIENGYDGSQEDQEPFNPEDFFDSAGLGQYELPSLEDIMNMSDFDLGNDFSIEIIGDQDHPVGVRVWAWLTITKPDGTTALALVSQTYYTITLDVLRALAERYPDLNLNWDYIYNTSPATVYHGTYGKTYDTPNGNINTNSDAGAQFERDMQNWANAQNQMPTPAELPSYGDPDAGLFDYFGELNLEPFGVGNIVLSRPLNGDQLREALYSYIDIYRNTGRNYITLSKMEIYHATSYHINTIRVANPVYPTRFRWSVLSPSGAEIVDSITQDPNEKVMFTSPGSYYVTVWQDKEVTRVNKVSGYKSEIWSLANGDQFDGLIFYAHRSYFEGNCSDDLGTQIEELQLTDDSFRANVTENMIGKVQFIDQYGGIHQVQNNFTTERIG